MSSDTKSRLLNSYLPFASRDERRQLLDQVRSLEQEIGLPVVWSSYHRLLGPEERFGGRLGGSIVVSSCVARKDATSTDLDRHLSAINRRSARSTLPCPVHYLFYAADDHRFSSRLNVRDILTPPLVISPVKPLAYRVLTGKASPADIVNCESLWTYWNGDTRRLSADNVVSMVESASSLVDLMGLIGITDSQLKRQQVQIRYLRSDEDYEAVLGSTFGARGFSPIDRTLSLFRGLVGSIENEHLAKRWQRSRSERMLFDRDFRWYRVARHIPLARTQGEQLIHDDLGREMSSRFALRVERGSRIASDQLPGECIWDAGSGLGVPVPWLTEEMISAGYQDGHNEPREADPIFTF